MLHSKKSQAILQWFHSLTTKGDVNSLEQFADGSHFYDIVASLEAFLPQGKKEDHLASESVIFSETSIACNEEVITSVEGEAAEEKKETSVSESIAAGPFVVKESDCIEVQRKYDAIEKFINVIYKVDSSSLIDYKECQKGKELELAKVAVFLLSAMVQHLVPSGDETVLTITLLEQEVQENIHECLSLVLVEKDPGENWIKKADLNKVLSRAAANHKGTPLRKQPSRAPDPVDSSDGTKSASKKRKERTSVYEDPRDSPLKTLLESPKIQYRAALFKKDSEMSKLRSALYCEENKVNDLTVEKQNLDEQLAKIKKELAFYKKELESQRKTLSEKEEQERLSVEEIKNQKNEEERLRKLVENQEGEITHLRKINEVLEKNIDDIRNKLEDNAASSLNQENKALKDKMLLLELDNEEKAKEISALNVKIGQLQTDVQMYQSMLEENASIQRKELIGSPNTPEVLSTIIYADEETKRLGHQQRKEKDSNIKALQDMVEHQTAKIKRLEEKVDRLAQAKSVSEEKLDYYYSKYGPIREEDARELKSIKKESDRIVSSTDDIVESSSLPPEGEETPSQRAGARSEDSLISHGRIIFDRNRLVSIVEALERKHCLAPAAVHALREGCASIRESEEISARLRDLDDALKQPTGPAVATRRSTMTRRAAAAGEAEASGQAGKGKSLEQDHNELKQNFRALKLKADQKEEELKNGIKDLEATNDDLKKEVENLREELALTQEKYIQVQKLANKRSEDTKRALKMFKMVSQHDKKEKEAKKECNEECEQIRRRCKQLNQECLEFQQQRAELKYSIKNLEGTIKNYEFDVQQLEKEKKELKLKLWEETAGLSRDTAERDALVYHYLAKSKHEIRNKDLELKNEQKKYSRPVVKSDAYLLIAENEPSTSSSMLAGRSIRNSFFQVDDEDDFLNESSLAEIHGTGESGERRLLEIQRRNTLCPPHLQSSYPLEIQNMTPSERKYYDQGGRSSLYQGKRKPRHAESDSEDSEDSMPVKRSKPADTSHKSVPVSKKQYPNSYRVAQRFRVQENPAKPSTPLKRVAAFVRRQSTFKTPMSVHRLISKKNKMH